MASIYDTVPTWDANVSYNRYDIVKGNDNKFYYSIINSNLGPGNNPTTLSNLQVDWDGYISLNGVLYPNFWWKPSYNTNASFKPKVIISQFGNGYQQRIKDGLNNNLAELSITFENRNEKETTSILHFFSQRNGQESFIYNMPTIYSKSTNNLNTKFICPEWTSNYVSYNNYSIQCKFMEVPV